MKFQRFKHTPNGMVPSDRGSYVSFEAVPKTRAWLDRPDELGNWMFIKEGDDKMIATHLFIDGTGELRAIGIGSAAKLTGKWQKINDVQPPVAKKAKVKSCDAVQS